MADRYFLSVDDSGRILGRFDAQLSADIPADAVAVARAVFVESLETRPGMECTYVDGAVAFSALAGHAEAGERAWRNAVLESVKWLRERHRDEREFDLATTLTSEQFSELMAYIQQLRDWPQSEQFPNEEHRPAPPTWLAQYN